MERLTAYGMSQSEFIWQMITGTAVKPVITVSSVNDELLVIVGKLTGEYKKSEVRAALSGLAAFKFQVLRKLATLKYIASKNADYDAAEQYLVLKHDGSTMKPMLDEGGRLIPRKEPHFFFELRWRGFCHCLPAGQSPFLQGAAVLERRLQRSEQAALQQIKLIQIRILAHFHDFDLEVLSFMP